MKRRNLEMGRQELEGDLALELRILSAVQYPHAAPADLLDDMVMRDGATDHVVRSYSLSELPP